MESDFLQTYYVVMTATNAIVEKAKCYQKENEHICVLASKYEEYWRFFKATLTEEAMITMFLNIVHKSLKVHAVEIKRSKLSWDAILQEITCLDNKEPREVRGSQVPCKRPSLAVEVDKYEGKLQEEETAKEIASLKRWLAELERPAGSSRGGKKRGARRGQVDKRDLRCYCCGKPGHFLMDCQGGQKQNNDPEAYPESRGRGKLLAWEKLDRVGRQESSSSFCKPSVVESSKLVVYGNDPGERIYGVCVEVLSEAAD